jgi:hypothetical protein
MRIPGCLTERLQPKRNREHVYSELNEVVALISAHASVFERFNFVGKSHL